MRAASKASLYVDAARNVKPEQLLGRLRRQVPVRVRAAGLRPRHTEWRPVAGGMGSRRAPQSGPTPPPHSDRCFRAVGRERRFGSPGFWLDRRDGLLFLFHLHGFERLAEYAAGERSAEGDAFWEVVIRSWLESNDRPARPGWHPFPTSNRIVAWLASLSTIDWPEPLQNRLAAETLRQARYLARSVEHDIGGNHVIRNGFALVVAGGVFPSSDLLPRGLGLLRREVGRQVLPDGGHEERSTSYHLEVLQDLGDVAELLERAGEPLPSWLSGAVQRMTMWCSQLRGPDGRLPLLNDAWESPVQSESSNAAFSHLKDSGHVVFRSGGDQLVFDVGPLSPRHLPPHAHADALSVVLWADGGRVLVDPGSFCYAGPMRDRFRGTAAHNTVEVDGEDQCLFWGDFRAAFTPSISVSEPWRAGDIVTLAARHDGYRRLPNPVNHHRTVVWWPGKGLVLVDLLTGSGRHAARSRLHLAPELNGSEADVAGPFAVRALGGQDVDRLDTSYSPYLGTMLPTGCLEQRRVVDPDSPFGWSLLRPPAQVEALEPSRLVMSTGQELIEVPLRWD